MGKVPQIVVKRPVFTRNVNKNEIDFVIETTVNSPIFNEIAIKLAFNFVWAGSWTELKFNIIRGSGQTKLEKVRKDIHLDTLNLRDTFT